jgi:hypothetical protein
MQFNEQRLRCRTNGRIVASAQFRESAPLNGVPYRFFHALVSVLVQQSKDTQVVNTQRCAVLVKAREAERLDKRIAAEKGADS